MQSSIPPNVWDLDLANGQSRPMLFENNLVAKGQFSFAKSELLALIKSDSNKSNGCEIKWFFSHHTM